MAGHQYDYKIILLGEAGVGKSSIFNRIKTGRFSVVQNTIQGTDLYVYTTTVGDDSLNVSLWDTAGFERFRTLTNNFYRNADGVLLVFCVEDSYTFDNLQGWITDASQHIALDKCEWALIGSKCDLQNEVETKRIEALLKQLNIKLFFYVSAKTGENVMHAFKELVTAIHEKHVRHSSGPPRPKNAVIDSAVKIESTTATSSKQKTSGCCN